MASRQYSAEEFVDAIRGSGGFVSVVANRLGCERSTVYRARERLASVDQAFQDEREAQKDMAEGMLQKQIREGNTTATIFYLKCMAKERGYVERQEVTGADGGSIRVDARARLDWGDGAED